MTKKVPCEVFCRVVGYYRPISNWNLGKKEEFGDRVHFKVEEAPAIDSSAPKEIGEV